jgi:prepilin-type N-terminal cleavage/methylation domain-containing protein
MRNRGFTLIEVLIALVIFVVGALAVIRIFPPAYNVVQNSGYSMVATRLSDSILAQMKGEGSTPEAVFDIKFDSTNVANNWGTADSVSSLPSLEAFWQDQDGAVVGTSDTNGSLPSGLTESAYDASALGHFRFIRGEKHEVQVAAVTDPISGSVTKEPYILTNFPYEVNSGVRAYIELAISDVTVDNTGLLDFTHATYTDPVSGVKTSFHDSGNANRPPTAITIAGASLKTRSEIPQGAGSLVNSGARYYVSYQWRYKGAANPAGNTVINEPVGIPDNTSTSWSGTDTMRVVQGAIINNETTKDRSVIAGPVPVKVRINLGIDSDGDIINFPNYFPPTSPSPFTAADRQQWAYLGCVPILDDPTDVSPHTLPANLPVYVDYLVPDWSTIYDQSISDSSGAVSLPISLLDPNTSIIGLLIDPTNQQLPKAIAGSIPTDKKGQVDYSNASAHIRTAYKGLDQWARQISPSAESYIPYVDVSGYTNVPSYRGSYGSTGNNPITTAYSSPAAGMNLLPREPWREYFWTSGSTIYFHASEAGKAVRVSYVYDVPDATQPSGKRYVTVKNQLLTIDSSIVTFPGGASDFVPTSKVVESHLIAPNNANVDSILGISGADIIARTAWLNGNRFQQSVVTGYRTANAD